MPNRISIARRGLQGLTLAVALAGFGPASIQAQEKAEATTTRLTIRAVARDAKIIGDGVGGAYIRVVNAATGEVLAEGRQEGGTGSTKLIMSTPRTRETSVFNSEGAAAFLAELRISEPTIVNVSATGPLGHPQAIHTATKQMMVVPGGHIEGDGVILELHGMIVEIQIPEPLAPVEGSVEVQARVRMMCGCELRPGGLWDSSRMSIVARLRADGAVVSESPLGFSGETSIFAGAVTVPAAARGRDLELEVLALDPKAGNFGRHAIPLGRQ